MSQPHSAATSGSTNISALLPLSSLSKGLAPGTISGMEVGAGIGGLVVLIAAVIFFLWYRWKKKEEAMSFAVGGPPPLGPKRDNNGPCQNWHQNDTPQADNKVTLLPKPSPPPGVLADPEVGATPQHPLTSSSLDFKKPHHFPSPSIGLGFSESIFTYEELAKATDGFADANLLGQGGFGYVHKGVLRNGKAVAIKQLKSGSGQGEREFCAEIEIISHVHHQHLVSLVGYCITGAQRMLVYEFVPNNNLEFHLHGKEVPTMNWSTRIKIALGASKGLAYLHEDCQPKIIHRDIKASNILLDDSYEAKVADFGLAKYSLDTDTHVSTRVMGTFGYLAPEYASTGKLTDKSDVFSFGVVLLELITGHRPVDRNLSLYDDSIVDWAWPLLMQALEDGNYDAVADPKLQKAYDCNEMARMMACAAACVRYSARLRPRLSQIVQALEGDISLDDLIEGMTPGYSTIFGSYGSSDYSSSSQHQEDLKKFRKVALGRQELAGSQYSGATGKYDQHPSSASTKGEKTTNEMEPPKLEKSTKDSYEFS